MNIMTKISLNENSKNQSFVEMKKFSSKYKKDSLSQLIPLNNIVYRYFERKGKDMTLK